MNHDPRHSSAGIGRATAMALARAGAVASFITGHALPIDGGLLAQ